MFIATSDGKTIINTDNVLEFVLNDKSIDIYYADRERTQYGAYSTTEETKEIFNNLLAKLQK